MKLTDAQIAQYDRDGFLVFPDLFTPDEVAVLRDEIARAQKVDDPCVVREGTGAAAKILLRMHETDGATASRPYRALALCPRALGVAQQLLRDDQLYVHHSKVNMKTAIEGSAWPWHQDYGQWKLDGIDRPDMTTVMVMLDEATEFNGCLYFVPGSHKAGRADPEWNDSTAYEFYALPAADVDTVLKDSPDPVAVIGGPGTMAVFDCNLFHASGHNLSRHNRWQAYICYNTVDNRPHDLPNPRPDYVRSTNWIPLAVGADADILGAALEPA